VKIGNESEKEEWGEKRVNRSNMVERGEGEAERKGGGEERAAREREGGIKRESAMRVRGRDRGGGARRRRGSRGRVEKKREENAYFVK
jgi:hypothetical protein